MTHPCTHRTISIDVPPDVASAFIGNPEHLPQWAAGLSGSIQRVGDDWIAESPMGRVVVRFVASNPFGVLDHFVTIPSGVTFYNPLRVVPNADGCEVIFTLFRHEHMTDQQYADDAAAIDRDLRTLKQVLEAQ